MKNILDKLLIKCFCKNIRSFIKKTQNILVTENSGPLSVFTKNVFKPQALKRCQHTPIILS